MPVGTKGGREIGREERLKEEVADAEWQFHAYTGHGGGTSRTLFRSILLPFLPLFLVLLLPFFNRRCSRHGQSTRGCAPYILCQGKEGEKEGGKDILTDGASSKTGMER